MKPHLLDCTAAQYHADYASIDALNWSTLKFMATSARLLKRRVENPQADTSARHLGRVFHTCVLEPERFPTFYRTMPIFTGLTKDGRESTQSAEAKAKKAEWLANIPAGVEIVEEAELATVKSMVEAIRERQDVMQLLAHTRREEVVQWTDPYTGIRCKMRGDMLAPMYLADLKGTRHQTMRAIQADFAKLLYHGQVMWYHDGAIEAGAMSRDAVNPYLIAVQNCEPFDVLPIQLSARDAERGRSLWQTLIRNYHDCQSSNWWPGLAPSIVDSDFPNWAPDGAEPLEEW